MSKEYPVVRNQPVAKFFYKGNSHTHPVRRTVVLIESKPNYFRGYELREGSEIRNFGQAPIKSFSKSKIARLGQIDRRRKLRASAEGNADLNRSTLQRASFIDLIKKGV
jgi:hypothetical protein